MLHNLSVLDQIVLKIKSSVLDKSQFDNLVAILLNIKISLKNKLYNTSQLIYTHSFIVLILQACCIKPFFHVNVSLEDVLVFQKNVELLGVNNITNYKSNYVELCTTPLNSGMDFNTMNTVCNDIPNIPNIPITDFNTYYKYVFWSALLTLTTVGILAHRILV
jgi:hypothetical protein